MIFESLQNQQSLRPYLKKAFVLHTSVLVLLLIFNYVEQFDWFKRKMPQMKIIEDSVKVDVVGMPKFTLQELKKMDINLANDVQDKPQKAKAEQINDDDLVYKKSKKRNFKDILSKYSKRKIKKKKIQKKENTIDRQQIRKLILEGNQVSKGSRLVGTYSEEEQSLYGEYVNNLPNLIRPYWRLPSYLLEQQLNCRIRVFISDIGELVRLQVQESSGNTEYDEKAQSSIRSAAPFPIPDSRITKRLAQSGIILGFPL
jgi:colicin import membrane protein